MTKRISRLEDLAALAGVSAATASRALSDGAVSSATRQRVLRLAREHGYRAPRAEGAADGLLLVRFAGAEATIAPRLIAAFHAAGPVTLVTLAAGDEDAAARLVRGHRAGGALFIGDGGLHDAFNRLAGDEDRFAVWTSKRPGQDYCAIGASDPIAGRRAMLHLAQTGRRRIAFVGDIADEGVLQRYRGYLDAHETAGLAPDPALVCGGVLGFEGGVAAAATLAAARADGVVAADDVIALGVVRGLAAIARAVPRDIAVLGFGDIDAGRWATPALSSIGCAMDVAAAETLAAFADGATPLRARRLPVELVVRESCGGAAVEPLTGAA